MRNLLIAIAILLAVIMAFGAVRGDRMKISRREVKGDPRYTVVVSIPDVSARYDRLVMFACAAEVTENGTYCRDDGWESTSELEIRPDQTQYPFQYLNWPLGTKRFTAVAVDRQGWVLVSANLAVFR